MTTTWTPDEPRIPGADVRFEIVKFSLHPRVKVERTAGLLPVLRGRAGTPAHMTGAVLRAVARRRWLLAAHHRARRALLEKSIRHQVARNCPPCGAFVRPFPHLCQLRDCPFCHGRSVAEDYMGLRAALECWARCDRPLRLVLLESGGVINTENAVEILKKTHDNAKAARDRQPGLVGGVQRVLFAPTADGSAVDVRLVTAWLLRDGAELMPGTAKRLFDEPRPTSKSAALRPFARAFAYPRAWADVAEESAAAAASLLDACHRVKLVDRFGALKPICLAANPCYESDGSSPPSETTLAAGPQSAADGVVVPD